MFSNRTSSRGCISNGTARPPRSVCFAGSGCCWSPSKRRAACLFFVPGSWESAVQIVFVPAGLKLCWRCSSFRLCWWRGLRVDGARRWCPRFGFLSGWFGRFHSILDLVVSFLNITDEDSEHGAPEPEQQAIEALVEAATEEGILEQDEARMIEQVVEFSDKRVREVMTPRPDVIAIPAASTLEQLRNLFVETKFSRIPVYEKNLDDMAGIVFARDMLKCRSARLATALFAN